MNKKTEKKPSKPISSEFSSGDGICLTSDEMKIVERYGFSFRNGMLLTPNEIEIMKNFAFFMPN